MGDSEQPSVETLAPAATNVGQVLRDARVAKDLTIDQLATELRIEGRQLTALEENRFEQIGAAVFVKGYLRQYAQRLGVDQQRVLALYSEQVQPTEVQIQPSRTIKLRDERQITLWVVALLLLALIVVALGVWWLNGGLDLAAMTRRVRADGFGLTPAAAPAPAATPEPTQPEPSPPPPPAAEPQAASVAPSEPVAAEPAPATERRDDDVTVAPSEGDEAPEAATAGVSLELTFAGESWTEITDARGERLYYGLADAGRRLTLRGEPPFAVVLGNADGVKVIVDGKPFDIPTRGRQGNLARFSITSDGD
jgi:cytoskeleton protein RodZ